MSRRVLPLCLTAASMLATNVFSQPFLNRYKGFPYHGSEELNPADGTYLNEFRVQEGVDTSYTKFDRKPDRLTITPMTRLFLLETCPRLAGPNPENGSTGRGKVFSPCTY